MDQFDSKELEQIRKETDAAIKKGWDRSRVEWREMALRVIHRLCLSKELITANDFTREILRQPIKTHDNRAIGGVIRTAQGLGWVTGTGEKTSSRAGHFSRIEVWKSQLYGKAQPAPIARPEQQGMFGDLPAQQKPNPMDETSRLRPDGRRR